MNRLFSLIFVLLLLTPALAWLARVNLDLDTHRSKVDPPRIVTEVLMDRMFYRALDQYFKDHFAFHEPLLRVKRWFDYHVFGATNAAEVHAGTDGWLYARKPVENGRQARCGDTVDVDRQVLELHAVEKLVEASGRRFVFTVAPNKSTIYPEHLGWIQYARSCPRSFYELFLERMHQHPLNGFVRHDRWLKQFKTHGMLLYNRDSSCWNETGAGLAAHRVLQQLAVHEVADPPMPQPHTQAEPSEPGDLKKILMGCSLPGDDHRIRHFEGSDARGLSKALVYGDRFAEALAPELAKGFSRVDVIQEDRIPSVQLGENLCDYETIVIEVVESNLESLRIDLNRIFASLEPVADRMARSRLPWDALKAVEGIVLRQTPTGMRIKSAGTSSILALSSIPGSTELVFRAAKLLVRSYHPSHWTFTFHDRRLREVSKTVQPGVSALYLPLPFAHTGTLHIQTGREPGIFDLLSVELLEFPNGDFARMPDPEPFFDVARQTAADAGEHVGDDADDIAAAEEIQAREPALSTADSERASACSRTEQDKSDATTAQEPFAITLSDFADGRIFQRSGGLAAITVSGTFTGKSAPVEARVVRHATGEEVTPWTVIDLTPRNGVFLGILPAVPQGGWYNLQARSGVDHAVVAAGRHRWGVGMLVACLGQSNMKEWFNAGSDEIPSALLRKFDEQGWSPLERQGNGAISFGNRLIERLNIPVGLLDFAVNGSGLRKEADWGAGYWQDTAAGSIYRRFIEGVSQAGGVIESIVWTQGEADAARRFITEGQYRASLESFIANQLRADVGNGSTQPQLPILIVAMIKRPSGSDEAHQAIRNAQKSVVDSLVNCYLAATTLDLENQGKEHLSPLAYTTLGQRVAQTVLHVLGLESYYRGPAVREVRRLDGQTIEVKLVHHGGSDITPDSGISGWQIRVGNTPIPIETVSRHDPETIRIVLTSQITARAEIRYLFGAFPDARRPIRDNSPLRLPLEAFQGIVPESG